MNIDLDINNYNVNDVLDLFKLNHDFGESELKRAYKTTLMTHPDKSLLDKSYFLFFSKAFKRLKYIYEFKKKSIVDITDKEYDSMDNISIEDNDEATHKVIKEKMNKLGSKEFNRQFNIIFDQVKIADEEHDSGYDEWMKETVENKQSYEIYNEKNGKSKKINTGSKLVKYDEFNEMNSSNQSSCSNLMRKRPDKYESDIFSKLPYVDYKQATEECIIPVNDEDYLYRKSFANVDNLMRYRKRNETLLTNKESIKILDDNRDKQDMESCKMAYNLSKQTAKMIESTRKFKAQFNLLQ